MLLSIKMKNEAVCEQWQTWARAGLGVNGMIDKLFINSNFSKLFFTNDSETNERLYW